MSKERVLPTYGEAWYKQKESIVFNNSKLYSVCSLGNRNPKMSREDANKYYTKRSREVFAKLGMTKKEIKTEFELRLPGIIVNIRKKTEIMLRREARNINNKYIYGEVT